MGLDEFDAAILSRQEGIPSQFIWPADEAPAIGGVEEIAVPVVDLARFLAGNDGTVRDLAAACEKHGFFQVVNHGVDPTLLAEAYRCCDAFYVLPLAEKQHAQRRPGENYGYARARTTATPRREFVGRFGTKLPWKETMSFNCSAGPESARVVVDYFIVALGEEYRHMGEVYQEYCNEMTRVALDVTDVLAACLGLGRGALRGFFAGDSSVMRLNHYPPCQKPHLTLGTGPHHDPTSLTLLHQDDVGGLEVFTDGAWRVVPPRSDAFVVNIGDTFSAFTNGRHISCLHRAVVNGSLARRSLTFFLNPQLDRPVVPPTELLAVDGRPRAYPDFTWREFLEFTQKHYRSDSKTLHAFVAWTEKGRDSEGPQI